MELSIERNRMHLGIELHRIAELRTMFLLAPRPSRNHLLLGFYTSREKLENI